MLGLVEFVVMGSFPLSFDEKITQQERQNHTKVIVV